MWELIKLCCRFEGTGELVSRLLLSDHELPPTVIDADGLNLLSETPDWHERLPANAIVTPHAGEMHRLTGCDVRLRGADRIEQARSAAREWNRTVVLKGPYTIIAGPGGRATVFALWDSAGQKRSKTFWWTLGSPNGTGITSPCW